MLQEGEEFYCDHCGANFDNQNELTEYNNKNLCKYCMNVFAEDQHTIIHSVAGMINVLEKEIKDFIQRRIT